MHSINKKHLSHPSHRPDIDGLRAIAVLSVVIFHAFPKIMPGGFVGVDVFFVISGFLISTILFENIRDKTFSFTDFYSRRIRRIFPALFLVLSASYAFGWFALLPDEFMLLGKNITAGAGFVSNFILWSESGYFDSAAEVKPLLHLWSLGIEEQFYIVWPLLLWGVSRLGFNALTVIIALVTASFILNIQIVSNDAIAAFYSPLTRIWELLIGAVVAYVFFNRSALSCWNSLLDNWLVRIVFERPSDEKILATRTAVSLLGLLLIIAGIFLLNRTRSFPGYWALLPTLGTALIIASGPKSWVNRKILSARGLVWIGLISYPLYLWHWPLLTFIRIVEGEAPSVGVRILAIFISALLAFFTYLIVEKPFRFGLKGRLTPLILALLMVAIGFMGYNTFVREGLEFRNKIFQQNKKQIKYQESFYENSACKEGYPDFRWFYCFKISSGEPTMQILGDSHANRLAMGLTKFSRENILQIGHHGCPPFLDIVAVEPGLLKDECVDVTNYAINVAANTDSIKTVIMTFAGAKYIGDGRYFEMFLPGEPRSSLTNEKFASAMRKTLDLLRAKNKTIIFVYDNPEINFDPNTCIDRGRPLRLFQRDVRSPCGIDRNAFIKSQSAYRTLVQSVLKDYPDIKIVDAGDATCDDQLCYAVKDGAILYHDGNHLSFAGSQLVGQEILKALK